jgi:bacillopeptidase F (M6 metalloprotease family)
VVANGGFESDGGWSLNRLAVYETSRVHSGARSARVGIPPGESGGGEAVWSSVSQELTLPAGSEATLHLWAYPINEGDDPGDQHYVVLFDEAGGYHSLESSTADQRSWVFREYDLSAFVGQTVTLYIGAKNDGDDDTTSMYIDDVALEVCQ